MKLFMTGLFLCALPAAFAIPAPCVSGSYASYQALVGGCSIGDATFSNFSSLFFVNSPGVGVLTPSEVQVTPGGTATDATLLFTYLNANGAPTPVTLNQLGQIFSFGLNFQIVVGPSALTGIQMDSTFGNTSPGSASATKSVQLLSGGPAVSSTVNDGGTSNALGTYNGVVMPVTGTGAFVVTDTTSLQAQSGSVTQSSFLNSFALTPASTTTPEVQTVAMIGFGLVFLSLVSHSTRKRQRRSRETRVGTQLANEIAS